MLKKESISKINPYVRLVQKTEVGACDAWFVPWRILYDFEIIFVLDVELVVHERKKEEYTLKKNDFQHFVEGAKIERNF